MRSTIDSFIWLTAALYVARPCQEGGVGLVPRPPFFTPADK